CWIESYADTFSWILEVPLIVCISVNLLLLISVLRVLIPKLNAATTSTSAAASSASRSTAGHDVAIKSAKAILFLSPLFGVHTIVTLWMPEEETVAHTVLGIIQALLQSSQGFVVAIVFCFGNSEVRNELKATFTMTTSMRRRRSTDTTTMGPLSIMGSKRFVIIHN
ncbi:diuretic hormone receptor-like, partial [Convolutriloba macropyga]|uniref:diuretic hormone receptor-like n=1 Tax=Convolutriloba macropyga TaxID=536237 RepID=UPI003F523493